MRGIEDYNLCVLWNSRSILSKSVRTGLLWTSPQTASCSFHILSNSLFNIHLTICLRCWQHCNINYKRKNKSMWNLVKYGIALSEDCQWKTLFCFSTGCWVWQFLKWYTLQAALHLLTTRSVSKYTRVVRKIRFPMIFHNEKHVYWHWIIHCIKA
jgi:hypothetical protein